ncbi:MAG TPA: dephospho-CoA kinase [Phycisphaerales bacterium]|nr:dephospho-CoA kinase [Phycisphaerae bacterium]HCT45290.1 dephospho-CoA kinase [Phycisphaerales bacterium]
MPRSRLIMPEQAHQPERVLIEDRPHIAFVFTQMWRLILMALVLWGVLRWFGMLTGHGVYVQLSWLPIGLIAVRFMLGWLDWLNRRHMLTESIIMVETGIIRKVRVEIPLRRVQHTILVRPFGERLMGIGSIGVTSAGTGGVDLVWRGVEHPQRVLDTIRAQVQRMSTLGSGKQVTPVIGIVGGIGSGKSTVARAFEELGCLVSDSDASVRQIMQEPGVQKTLRSWWGDRVIDSKGQVDRSAIAQIVFESEIERRKLEGLIHPLVHQRRHELIDRARKEGVQGVIVDAPLLFEAGVDSECDAVVFVDTPRETRLARVKSARGWDDRELDRREKTQLGLEEKRKRSDYVLSNTGLPEELHGRVARVLGAIQKDLRDRQTSG